MDTKTDCVNSHNSLKTDLRLLLECLKFQMNSPDLQKQALLTIHSICEKRADTVDILRELGGVTFVLNLSKSSAHADVKEAALFTLSTVAEANVYCKNSLCRKETFAQLAGLLINEDTPLTQKRVSVYFLSVLIANNKTGQTLAQTTGCLDILLDLFRTTFPISTDDVRRPSTDTSQNCQFWTSVCSALCGCVNNPQNEEGQRICVSVFPIVSMWLQQISLPRTEIFQPICSFIAMTVANNSCVQQSFFDSGALNTLALALIHQASAADQSLLSYQLSVTIAKTLSACITDNRPLASAFASYGVVPHLFSVLTSPHLVAEDRLSVLLTLCHCTEASEEHQSQLVQCGGLPLIITLLTEDANEEVRKAATFILQTCKQATMALPGLIVRQGERESEDHLANMDLKTSTQKLLHSMDLLQRSQAKENVKQAAAAAVPPLMSSGGDKSGDFHAATKAKKDDGSRELKNASLELSAQDERAETSAGAGRCTACQGTGAVMCSSQKSLGGVREHNSADDPFIKTPVTMRQTLSSSSEKKEERVLSPVRCAGCVLSFDEVTSRTFPSLQSACRHSCDLHKVLQEATDRFRVRHCHLAKKGSQSSCVGETSPDRWTVSPPEKQRSRSTESSAAGQKGAAGDKESLQWRMQNHLTLAPRNRGVKNSGVSLTPLKTSHRPRERRQEETRDSHLKTHQDCSALREHVQEGSKRKEFSREEVVYLLEGVATYGFSWNSILWSYPFKAGRTNVSLAKKYSQLMKSKAKDSVCD